MFFKDVHYGGSDGDCDDDGAPYADAFLVKLTPSGGGKDDLLYGTYLGGHVSVLLNNGDGTFAPRVNYDTAGSVMGIASADFNQDTYPDLVVACNQGKVYILLANDDGTFQPYTEHLVGGGAYAVCTGDFTEEDCTNAGGTVEPPLGLHPDVCNGPFVASQSGGDMAPGALLLAADEVTFEGGFPVGVAFESGLPCGDEAEVEESVVSLVFTTSVLRAAILDRDDVEGEELAAEVEGETFSCDEWTQEDAA